MASTESRLRVQKEGTVTQVEFVDRNILRLSTYETVRSEEIPVKVAINEAVELAKMFGAEQSYRYVNSVLDKVARELRQ